MTSHETQELLIGCTVNGYINYTSQLWFGNASDKLLVEKSGFLDLLEPGDKVMADKGFGIRGMLAVKKSTLVLPHILEKEEAQTPWCNMVKESFQYTN